MKNKLMGILVLGFMLAPFTTALAMTGSEVHITSDGSAKITSVKVMQIAGSTLYTRLYWGDSFIRLLVKTTASTKFYRGTGELTTLSEISVGNVLDLSGQLESGSENMVLIAATVKNSSVQKQQTTLFGKVASVDLASSRFTLTTSNFGLVTVNTTSATQFTKGNRALDLAHVAVGDTITRTSGDYDLNSKTLVATNVVTFVDMNMYKPQNYQGVLQSVSGTSLPASVKVTIGNTTYTVMLTLQTYVLNKNKSSALLTRFVAGDTVRFYGAIREVDDPIIDATIIRNLNL